jgi:hypothetical protein
MEKLKYMKFNIHTTHFIDSLHIDYYAVQYNSSYPDAGYLACELSGLAWPFR